MNGAWTDVQNWLDLLDHIWIGLVLIAAASVPAFISARTHRGIKSIKDQVVNGHTEPLRSDLDRVIAALKDMGGKVDGISHGVSSLREELVVEETRRRASVQELREDFDRKMGELVNRFVK